MRAITDHAHTLPSNAIQQDQYGGHPLSLRTATPPPNHPKRPRPDRPEPPEPAIVPT
ncbi:unnamed protein product [[Actinomadura] parvosata subsp. kistnae]|nr:unnamed protein product [Actinomadura parvosata subsp. kistnae]